LAYHYERSAADEKAVEYLLKAGEKAKGAYSNEAAIGYFQRALERLAGAALGAARKDWRLEALRRLGEIYHDIGKEVEAEAQFRQALALGREMGLAPQELARLVFWLGDALFWQGRAGEIIGPAEEALALLKEAEGATDEGARREGPAPGESVEAALLNSKLCDAYRSCQSGDEERAWECIRRNAQFLPRLPYSEELRDAYWHVHFMYSEEDNVEEARTWLQAWEQRARQHNDLRALGDVFSSRADDLLAGRGDLLGSIAPYQQALEPYGKIGAKQYSRALIWLGALFLSLGRLKEAEEYAKRGLETAEASGSYHGKQDALHSIGCASLCQGRCDRATDAFRRAAQIDLEDGWNQARAAYDLGRASLAQGKRWEAQRQFQSAALECSWSRFLVDVLSGLDEAYDDADAFMAFCRRFREEHPEVLNSPFVHWYLEPAEPEGGLRIPYCVLPTAPYEIHNTQRATLNSGWVWHDPFGDCSLTLRNGLEIRAANGRDLWRLNRSAPRLLRPVSGDFAVQAVCCPVSEDSPAIGGILLWRDKVNYLRLERGTRGPHEISFHGWLANKEALIGRGRLPGERLILRLERIGLRVHALCSADGQNWFTVGQVEFPVEDPVEVGVHAIGAIDRLIYPGAYPEGTAIRFESFEVWE
jgi:tetratricopeptide (TPR) repeat protein/regulation of enolase protein 1 (concanavalin A-like superfamily)